LQPLNEHNTQILFSGARSQPMTPFAYEGLPARVIFGHGTLEQVGPEVDRLGCKRVMVISTPQQSSDADRIAQLLGATYGATYTGAVMHTPVEVTDEAMQIVYDHRIEGTVAIGGGSTIGLGKAIAPRTDLPQLVIPSTYAGS
jgi:alcohol dehydrogenase class IV